MKKLLLITLLALWGCSLAAANVIYVDCNGPNDPGSGTFVNPFRRIQPGIDAAVNGDTIEIAVGIYTGSGNYNLDPKGKSIVIKSTEPNNNEIVANTIINPNQAGRGFYIHSGEGKTCVISGLTVRNAYIGTSGAGIYCYNSNPSITKCIIRANTADHYGGGISCYFSSPKIIDCVISDNFAGFEGGGIDNELSNTNFFNCIITANKAGKGGGFISYYSDNDIVNCTFAANSANDIGGAIYCAIDSVITIKNSILWANSANNGNQIGLINGGIASITYSDIQGGQQEISDPCHVLNWGQGNIDIAPCFASFDPNGDPNLWDFHLRSTDGRWDSAIYIPSDLIQDGFTDLKDFTVLADQWSQQGEELSADIDKNGEIDFFDLTIFTENYLTLSQPQSAWIYDNISSPCLNAGDPNSDWSAEPWPNGKRINTGALGGTNQASKSGNISDLNVDSVVNFFDLAEIGNVWGINETTIEDLDNNGIIDIGDLDILAANWLWEQIGMH